MVQFLQSNFSVGEITPKLYARQDYEGYYKSLKRARNVLIIPQGGLRKRFGTQYAGIVNSTSNYKEVAQAMFKIGALSQYHVVFQPDQIRIFYERKEAAFIDQIYSPQEIEELRFVPVGDSLFILHENYIIQVLEREPSDPVDITALGDAPNSLKVTALGMVNEQVLPVKFETSGTLPSTLPQITEAGTYFIRCTGPDEFSIHEDPKSARLNLNPFRVSNFGITSTLVKQNDWVVTPFEFKTKPTYDFNRDYYEARFDFDHTTRILTCDTAVFTAEHVGGLFIFPFDAEVDRLYARIESFTNATTVVVEGEWTSSAADMRGSDCFLLEPVFSDKRGWPKNGDLFQNRLVLAGNRTLPGVTWLSVTNNETDFDDSNADDTSAISLISNKNAGIILWPIVSKTLTLFTTSGVFNSAYSSSQAITPQNANITQASPDGAEDVKPVVVDNQILFVSKGGKVINSILFDIQINSYRFSNANITSEHLLDIPLYACELKNNASLDSSYALFSNTDGTLAIYHTLLEQQMSGWTGCSTDGLFRQSVSLDGEVAFIVQRTIQDEVQIYIEYIDFDYNTDSGLKFTFEDPVSTLDGLEHLNGKTIKVIADGYVYDAVPEDGEITLNEPASIIEVGLPFSVEIAFNNFATADGSLYLFKDKILKTVYIDLVDTLAVKVNGEDIPDLSYGYTSITSPPELKTDVYKLSPMTGPNPNMTLSITQDEPFSFNLRAIGFEVK